MQLPDFQRGWVWDDERIKSLLASISAAFPIGAVMLMETGGETRFKPRPVEGTDPQLESISPDTLILDGQQRFTSLYRALICQSPVAARKPNRKFEERWYYINMVAALASDSDREEAIVSVPVDRIVKTFGREISLDLSCREKEYAEHHFPMNSIFDSAEWRQGYCDYWRYDKDHVRLFNEFEKRVIKRFEQYQVPVIKLTKETPKEAVCLVFEKVNTGGVTLDVFDLLTASFAADGFQLRDDWEDREKELKSKHKVLRDLEGDDFLQVVALLATQSHRRDKLAKGVESDRLPGIGCKRKDILGLEVAEYRKWAPQAQDGFIRAARFLHSQKIFASRDLPYKTQLVPLAAILADLGPAGETEGARRKIARWYWCGVLGEMYGGTLEYRFARDLPEVVNMVNGEGDPATVSEAYFSSSRLLTLRTRNSAAYKGVYALLMREGCRDFRTGEPIESHTFLDDRIDIHHIFPRAWCQDQQIDKKYRDSIVNKTAISSDTNKRIGRKAPSDYIPALEQSAGIDPGTMDSILLSHRIAPDLLRADDFWGAFSAREDALIRLIEDAMGKPVMRDSGSDHQHLPVEEDDAGPIDWDEF
jgi:hypothetical protein